MDQSALSTRLVDESPESREELNKANSKDTNVSAMNNDITKDNDREYISQ